MHPIKKLGIITSIATMLLPFAALAAQDTGLEATAGAAYGSIPPGTLQVIIGNVIKGALGLVGVIFLVLMVYAGYLWMTARGEEAKAEQAKDTITRAIIGIVIVIGAYALTSFIINALTQTGTPATTATGGGSSVSCTVGGNSCPTDQYCDSATNTCKPY